MGNGLVACEPGHPLIRWIVDHLDRPWLDWGGEDVPASLRVMAMVTPFLSQPQTEGFITRTGPGFFTRAIMAGMTQVDDHGICILSTDYFSPLGNWEREDAEAL